MSLHPVAYRHFLDHLAISGSLAESAKEAGLTRAELHHAIVTDPTCRKTWYTAKRRLIEPDRVTPPAARPALQIRHDGTRPKGGGLCPLHPIAPVPYGAATHHAAVRGDRFLSDIASPAPRQDWRRAEVEALFALPFADLIHQAQTIHRHSFDPNRVQLSTLLSIKTGGCPEDCGYCSQSAHVESGVKAEKLMALDAVLADARRAKAAGATRYCMGAAWRSPKAREIDRVCDMIEGVRALGLETCATLGMLTDPQATRLKQAGLDYYNHNIDTSPEFYDHVVTTRTFQDRLDTLESVRAAGINVCCGGIVGLGESRDDRIGMLLTLATLPEHPASVPINMLAPMAGTPLGLAPPLDPLELVRVIAVARILMPRSMVRLSAGREALSDEAQALCYLAGANSIFFGPRLLTTGNPARAEDDSLFRRLGIQPMEAAIPAA